MQLQEDKRKMGVSGSEGYAEENLYLKSEAMTVVEQDPLFIAEDDYNISIHVDTAGDVDYKENLQNLAGPYKDTFGYSYEDQLAMDNSDEVDIDVKDFHLKEAPSMQLDSVVKSANDNLDCNSSSSRHATSVSALRSSDINNSAFSLMQVDDEFAQTEESSGSVRSQVRVCTSNDPDVRPELEPEHATAFDAEKFVIKQEA